MRFNLFKNKELILYLICGVLTTVVNFVVFIIFNKILGEKYYLISNLIAFIISVIFAFVVNKYFVFLEKNKKISIILKELLLFTSARIVSFCFEELGLWIFDLLGFSTIKITLLGILIGGHVIAKVFLSIIVIIANYFFTKFVFKKK